MSTKFVAFLLQAEVGRSGQKMQEIVVAVKRTIDLNGYLVKE
jgi:hypothetical protein